MKLIKRLLEKNKQFVTQVLKFASVGVVNTLLDFGILTLLVYIFESHKIIYIWGIKAYIIAQTISFGLAVINSYLFNKYWTFNASTRNTKTELIKMYTVNGIAFFITLGGLWLFHDVLSLHILIAKVIVTPFVMALNFLATKYWVFYESKKKA